MDDIFEFEVDLPPPITGSIHLDKEATIVFIDELMILCDKLQDYNNQRPSSPKLQAMEVLYEYTRAQLHMIRVFSEACKTSSGLELLRAQAQDIALDCEIIDTCLMCQNDMEYLH